MNALYWIAYVLFALTFYASIEHNALAASLGFIASIVVAIMAVHADDLKKKR
jgi:hypothetical protein